MASPTPVLPEVGSTIVPPGLSLPSRSACSIIARPIRSLTEPPGLRYSSLARIRAWPAGESLSSRTIGVPPTRSRTVGYSRGIAGSLVVRETLEEAMKITVIGRGNVGGGLARRWCDAGHEVEELGRDGGDASGADVLLVAVPGPEIANALRKVSGLDGKLTIDATNA